MFRSEIFSMLNNYKALQKENKMEYLNTQLIEAVSNKKTEMVKTLLEKRCDSHVRNKKGHTLLSIAICNRDLETANMIIRHDSILSSLPNDRGLTPMLIAIYKGNKDIVELLLQYNVNVDKEFEGIHPIAFAIDKGFTEIVDVLIKHKKAFPELKNTMGFKKEPIYHDEFGRTLLTIASENNDVKTARCIIEYYPELVYELNADGSSALFVAASKGNVEVLDLLISKRANVNQTIHGATPIYIAAAKGYHTIVKLLLDNKADANQFYQNIQSTLSIAISGDNIETVAILLEAKANVDTVDLDGMTPLHTAIRCQNHAIVKLMLTYHLKNNLSKKEYLHRPTANESSFLLEAKGDIDSIKNQAVKNQIYEFDDGCPPLTAKIIKNHQFLIDLELLRSLQTISFYLPETMGNKGSYAKAIVALLENKPELNKQDTREYLSLHYAAEFGELGSVKTLIEQKADINMPTPTCDAPLVIATRKNKVEILNLLLEKKADVACTDKNGTDLLMIAAYCGSYAVISPIIKKNFDVNKMDAEGMTPLMAAIYQYAQTSEAILKLNYLGTIVELLKNSASFMKKGDKLKCSPISLVIQSKFNHLLTIFLEYPLDNDLNAYSNRGFCPLHEAVISDNEEACEILLAHPSVNIDQCDGYGLPPLYYAIINERANMIELLLRNGANTSLKCAKNDFTIDDLLKLHEYKKMRQLIQSIKEAKPTPFVLHY